MSCPSPWVVIPCFSALGDHLPNAAAKGKGPFGAICRIMQGPAPFSSGRKYLGGLGAEPPIKKPVWRSHAFGSGGALRGDRCIHKRRARARANDIRVIRRAGEHLFDHRREELDRQVIIVRIEAGLVPPLTELRAIVEIGAALVALPLVGVRPVKVV